MECHNFWQHKLRYFEIKIKRTTFVQTLLSTWKETPWLNCNYKTFSFIPVCPCGFSLTQEYSRNQGREDKFDCCPEIAKQTYMSFSNKSHRYQNTHSQLFEMASWRNIQSHFWAFNIQCNIGSKLEHLIKIFFLSTFFDGNDQNFPKW